MSVHTDDSPRAPNYEVLRLLYETMNDGVVAFDSQGRIVFCNPAMGLLVGARTEELVGLTTSEAWGGELIELPDETASTGGQFVLRRRDGSRRIVTARSFYLRTTPPLQVAIYRDVTRWRATENTLRALLTTSLQHGRDSFTRQLVAELVRVLGVPYAFLGILDTEDPKLLHVEVCWARTGYGTPFATRLEGTPCENLVPDKICHFRSGAWRQFPEDSFLREHAIEGFVGAPIVDSFGKMIGLLAAMDTSPLQEVYDSRTFISLFAAHAALGLAQFEATRELEETRERYEALVEQAREGFYLRDIAPTRILFVNRTLREMFGYTEEEILRMHPLEAVAPEAREKVGRLIAKMVERRRPHLIRFLGLRKDGRRFVGELLPSFVTYRGRPCLQATVRDVTEKVRVEQERILLTKLVSRLAGDDTIERISRTVQEITQELFQWDAYCFVVRQPGDERRRVIEYVDTIDGTRQVFPGTSTGISEKASGPMRRALGGDPVLLDVAEHGPDDTLHPFGDTTQRSQTLLYAPIRTPRGVIGVISVQSYRARRYDAEDLALLTRVADAVAPALERARAEHLVRESEERYRKLVELAPAAIFLLTEGRIRYANPAAVKLLGATSLDDLLDVDYLHFIADPVRPAVQQRLVEVAAGKGQMPAVEYELVALDGRKLIVESREIATTLDDVPALQIVLQDVTAHKEALRRIQRSEQQLKLLFEQTPLAVIRWGRDFRVEDWNPAAERIFGYRRAEAIGRHAHELIVPASAHEHIQQVWQALLERRGGLRSKNINVTKDGRPIVCEWYNTPLVDSSGNVIGVASLVQDVTEAERMREALEESQERYVLAMLGSNDGIWDWNFRTGMIYFSDRWKEILGVDPSQDLRSLQDWVDRVHPEDRALFEDALARHLEAREDHFEVEVRMLHALGHAIWVLCRGVAIRDAAGTPLRMAGSLSDITSRKVAEEQARHDAIHDSLTGLGNRAVFLAHVEQALGMLHRDLNYGFAALLLDIDRFKLINDSYGHSVGDELLRQIGQRLKQLVRTGDVVARLGGDEFAILFERVSSCDQAEGLAESVLAHLRKPFLLTFGEIYVTASAGLVVADSSYTSGSEILRDADTAMFRAKTLGKNRYEVFVPELRLKALNRLQLETDLRRALAEGQFEVLYQPIVRLQDRKVCDLECIVRWQHPLRGTLLPFQFIQIAEETGIICDLGLIIFEKACFQLAEWLRLSPQAEWGVSVNVSPRQLHDEQFLGQVREILARTHVPPSRIMVELTEGVFLEENEVVRAVLQQLHEMKLRLAVDDFGSGYSSFGYLQRFPLDVLKIDQMFISSVGTAHERPGILETIVELGHSLGLGIIAEGIENEVQEAKVAALGIECGQGYLYAPPLQAEKVFEFCQNFSFAARTSDKSH